MNSQDKTYSWKRFWCPRTGRIDLSDDGYLSDPDVEGERAYNSDVMPFESIESTSCLALLGEPGIGKTSAMNVERKSIEAQVLAQGDQVFWLDLSPYGDENRLICKLFKSDSFTNWVKGTHKLHLFLDSLDECLLRIDNIAMLLIDELGEYPVDRLYLRIACRTAVWPGILESEFKRMWGHDSFGAYELAPLRRVDIIEAAIANNIDPEAFLAEIDRMRAVPLAIRPVTLGFLLKTYPRPGRFPTTQKELYLEGCLRLCEEISPSRQAAGMLGDLDAEQRLAVAARIAAITVFANRYAVWTTVDSGEVPEEDVTIQDLCGGTEVIGEDRFQINHSCIRETLDTGLFSSRGQNRMGWAHKTYAEFLAAQYLIQHQLELPQIMSLVHHPLDTEEKVVPQLHETAAWLAVMKADAFQEIKESDPEVLLRSDVATVGVADRASLVEALLRLYQQEKLRDSWLLSWYGKLAHPDLAKQLLPYISDTAGISVARITAIYIAIACELRELQDQLADIALNTRDDLHVRVEAAHAIVSIGNDKAKARMKPLAVGEAGDDPRDELKGFGLRVVWPDHMTADELFASLTYPKRRSDFGLYSHFLSNELAQNIRESDLPVALEWIETNAALQKPEKPVFDFEKLMDAIMLRAWEHLGSPSVLECFAKAALSLLRHQHRIVTGDVVESFRSMLTSDTDNRRRVLKTMVSMVSDPKDASWLLYFGAPSIVYAEDISWMLEQVQGAHSEREQRIWAQLTRRIIRYRENEEQLNTVLIVSKENPILAEEFRSLFGPIEIDSPLAKQMKDDYLMEQESRKWENPPLLEPPPAERIAIMLNRFESGDSDAWWQLNMEMTLEPNSTRYGSDFESNLIMLPGWKVADDATRIRIVVAARQYILKRDPEVNKWLGTNTFYRPAFAGYRALRLLQQEVPGLASTIPIDVWKRWAPVILAYPVSDLSESNDEEEAQHKLIKMAYQYAPDEIVEALTTMIDYENSEGGYIHVTRKIENCWDERLEEALLSKLDDKELKPGSLFCLLSLLLDHSVSGARAFAEQLLHLPDRCCSERRSKAICAGRALMFHTKDAGWSVVWPEVQQNVEFGRELFEPAAYWQGPEKAINEKLTEDQLAELYIWLDHQYPFAEDPKYEEVHVVTSRESIAIWKSDIIRDLQWRGTYDACNAIRRIIQELPHLDWLKWTLLEAQRVARYRTWTPPLPDHILKIAENQELRLVQSGDQLLEVLIRSLGKLEEELQGETPAAIYLWDKVSRNVYRPKDENNFSNYVKLWLDRDIRQRGIIVNREVEIRRGEGTGKGERTDIHVDAVVRDKHGRAYDRITVIIEAKGCWNKDLLDAMETQLVDRYLKDNRCKHGLYLVGWFNCEQWDNSDDGKKRADRLSSSEVKEQLNDKAAILSQRDIQIKVFLLNTALR